MEGAFHARIFGVKDWNHESNQPLETNQPMPQPETSSFVLQILKCPIVSAFTAEQISSYGRALLLCGRDDRLAVRTWFARCLADTSLSFHVLQSPDDPVCQRLCEISSAS